MKPNILSNMLIVLGAAGLAGALGMVGAMLAKVPDFAGFVLVGLSMLSAALFTVGLLIRKQ